MSHEKIIKNLEDFIALSEDEFERFAEDFCTFVFYAKRIKKTFGDEVKFYELRWIDDGQKITHLDFFDTNGNPRRVRIE